MCVCGVDYLKCIDYHKKVKSKRLVSYHAEEAFLPRLGQSLQSLF